MSMSDIANIEIDVDAHLCQIWKMTLSSQGTYLKVLSSEN
jgi:hypothetical protein